MRTMLGMHGKNGIWSLLLAVALAGCGSSSGGGGAATTDTADVVTDSTGGSDGSGVDATGGSDTTAASDTSTGSDASGADTTTDSSGDTADTAATCTLPDEGVCTGTVLSWCADDGKQTYDCADDSADFAVTCGKVSESWGYDCLVPTGEDCTFLDADDNLDWSFCAGGSGAACAYGKGVTPACMTGAPTCADADIGTCKDGFAVMDCAGDQGWLLDCKAMGAACKAGTDGATCEGVAKGGACDGEVVTCATGTTCKIAQDDVIGVCE